MKTLKRRPILFAVGAVTVAALLPVARPVHAQALGGSGGLIGPSGPLTLPTAPSSGRGINAPATMPSRNTYGGGIYGGRGYGAVYGPPGGFFGGYPGQGYARGYSWTGQIRQFTLGGEAQVTGLPTQSRETTTAARPRPTLGGSAGLLPPPVLPGTGGGGQYTNGSGGGGSVSTYAPPPFYGPTTFSTGGPALLGGYYYGGYCDDTGGADVYPSVYGEYDGFPGYVEAVGPGVTITSFPTAPVYVDDPQPFYPPTYTVNYNQTNYYVASPDSAANIAQGGPDAPAAVKKAYPADSYQAAFADIERAWDNGDVSLLKKHLRSDDTKVSVSLKSAYKYSLNSSDFAQITRDAFDRLDTVSFKFTALQKAKNGDVTAYGTHTYRPETSAADGAVAAFDPDSAPTDADTGSGDANGGTDKTVYVSYTLRHGDTGWYVTAINSSTEPLLKTAS